MATYTTTPDGNGGFTVRTQWGKNAVTFHHFATQAEAQAWIVGQTEREEAADRLERRAPRSWRG
jgi:hypothetical protein